MCSKFGTSEAGVAVKVGGGAEVGGNVGASVGGTDVTGGISV